MQTARARSWLKIPIAGVLLLSSGCATVRPEQRAILADPLTGGERLDPRAFDRGLEGEVEVAERLPGRQTREAQRSLQPSFLAAIELGVEEPVNDLVGGDVVLDGIADQGFKLLGGVHETEALEPLASRIEIDGRGEGIVLILNTSYPLQRTANLMLRKALAA